MSDSLTIWESDLRPMICELCDSAWLAPRDYTDLSCPGCRGTLQALDDSQHLQIGVPELVVPLTVSDERQRGIYETFAKSIWLAPNDLSAEQLLQRSRRIFLPMWLVDLDVTTVWNAEVGFDYEVVSHAERYQGGQWQTIRKNETRIRWEMRVGALERHYDNTRAPALSDHAQVVSRLGRFTIWDTEPYSADHIANSLIRLPDRESADVWADAGPAILQRVEQDCQKASGGQHLRQFKWDPAYDHIHWSKLLLPTIETWYYDDDGVVQYISMHGQSGQLYGKKRASMPKALRLTLVFGMLAILLYLGGAYLSFRESMVGGYLTALAVIAAVFGAYPPFYVFNTNRSAANSSK